MQESEEKKLGLTWNSFALGAGLIAMLCLLGLWMIGYLAIAFANSPYPPAGLVCAHTLTYSFTMIGGLAGLTGGRLGRNGFDSWILAAAMFSISLFATAIIQLPSGYPSEGPHEFVVAGATAAIATALGSCVAVLRLRPAALRRRAVSALIAAAVFSLLTSPGVASRNLDTQLPLSVWVERTRMADIQDYSHFSLVARSVRLEQAEAYAARVGLSPGGNQSLCDTIEPSGSESPQTWHRDERTPTEDRRRYPSGYKGCWITACWHDGMLAVADNCDWGI